MTNVNSMSVLDAVYPFNFQDTEIQVLDVQGRVWLTAADLSRALGYSKSSKVSELYQRNSDEFTDDMTTVITLQANESAPALKLRAGASATGQARIFSTQGCHLVAMLARTDRAKEFRRWVLSVLGGLDKKNPPKKAGLSEVGKAAMLDRVLDKATDMVLAKDGDIGQRRIDKLAEDRAVEMVDALRKKRLYGTRLLTTPTDDGGFETRALDLNERILSDAQLAAYIGDSQNGPATYWLPKIIAAANQRMIDMCELPFVERDHEQN